jgi:alpha-galactosidase
VGLFNLSEAPREVAVAAADLGLGGAARLRVRDLWRWKELGAVAGRFSTTVGRHGVMLVRMWPASSGGK